jgi:oligopeptide/dipeptide ABC transporter ATP-binding protein
LNPVFRVGYQIAEALRLHRRQVDIDQEVVELLRMVGIADPERRARAYPHELSGGMQQRAMIAMALACRPRLLVADEPTTALDVTIQAQILELLADLQKRLGMAILLITHNLGLVAGMAHRTHVMYAGQIVESGDTERVLRSPRHPYTKGLLQAVPRLQAVQGRLKGIDGVVPNPFRMPDGCRFHPRCPMARDICRQSSPAIVAAGEDQASRCHFWQEVSAR